MKEEKLPQGYAASVYKEYVARCGAFPLGIAVEIEGPQDHVIEDLDRILYAKIR